MNTSYLITKNTQTTLKPRCEYFHRRRKDSENREETDFFNRFADYTKVTLGTVCRKENVAEQKRTFFFFLEGVSALKIYSHFNYSETSRAQEKMVQKSFKCC